MVLVTLTSGIDNQGAFTSYFEEPIELRENAELRLRHVAVTKQGRVDITAGNNTVQFRIRATNAFFTATLVPGVYRMAEFLAEFNRAAREAQDATADPEIQGWDITLTHARAGYTIRFVNNGPAPPVYEAVTWVPPAPFAANTNTAGGEVRKTNPAAGYDAGAMGTKPLQIPPATLTASFKFQVAIGTQAMIVGVTSEDVGGNPWHGDVETRVHYAAHITGAGAIFVRELAGTLIDTGEVVVNADFLRFEGRSNGEVRLYASPSGGGEVLAHTYTAKRVAGLAMYPCVALQDVTARLAQGEIQVWQTYFDEVPDAEEVEGELGAGQPVAVAFRPLDMDEVLGFRLDTYSSGVAVGSFDFLSDSAPQFGPDTSDLRVLIPDFGRLAYNGLTGRSDSAICTVQAFTDQGEGAYNRISRFWNHSMQLRNPAMLISSLRCVVTDAFGRELSADVLQGRTMVEFDLI